MKTKWFLSTGLLLLSALGVSWIQQGCTGTYPLPTSVVVTATPSLPSDVVTNFEDGTGKVFPTLKNTNLTTVLNTNPAPAGINGNAGPVTVTRNYAGSFTASTYGGGAMPNTINNPFVLLNPGNGSNYAIHISCPLNGTGAYEADQLTCALISGAATPYYDASVFTGIKFDINIPPSDTNPQRVFQIPTDVTTPATALGGTCPTGCYNHYQAVLPAGSTGGWITLSYNWNQIVYPGFGANNGPDVSTHLTKVLGLQWAFSANGAVILTQTDFWIDNVQFLP